MNQRTPNKSVSWFLGALLALLPVLWVLQKADAEPSRQVVGYYTHWTRDAYPHTAIPYQHLTHIAHAFIWPRANGTLHIPKTLLYPELNAAAHKQGVKMIITVGGWGQSMHFPAIAADPLRRQRFIRHLLDFCHTHGYDGIDLDWEYPTASDKSAYVQLLSELRTAIDASDRPLSLSILLPAVPHEDGYDAHAINTYLDWVNLMTFDYHGDWSPYAGHNAPLVTTPGNQYGSVRQSVEHWLGAGLEPARINLGVPFYGRLFEAERLHGTGTGQGTVTYAEAQRKQQAGWTLHRDEAARVPYLISADADQVLTFDDTQSIQEKMAYLKTKNLRGVMVWALGFDADGEGTQPLLEAVGTVFHP